MKRLQATFQCDVRLQWRNGFYYATAVVVVLFALLLRWLPEESTDWLLPVAIVNNLIINGFYFVAALVLLEKGEGTLQAQIVTPLRAGEYLLAKVATLSLLSLVETLAIVLLIQGPPHNLLVLSGGVLLGTAIYTLAGFLVVARYDAINQFLLPSTMYVLLLALPLLPYFGVLDDGLVGTVVYLHPLQAIVVLLQGGLQPVPGWQIVYGLGYGALWLIIFFRQALRAFRRFVVSGDKGRKS